jgi:hypothetical protein
MNKIFTKPHLEERVIERSRQKGYEFEGYVVTLFNENNFQLLEWRSDKKASNGVYPLSCTYPDLEFRSRGKGSQRFAVECK